MWLDIGGPEVAKWLRINKRIVLKGMEAWLSLIFVIEKNVLFQRNQGTQRKVCHIYDNRSKRGVYRMEDSERRDVSYI